MIIDHTIRYLSTEDIKFPDFLDQSTGDLKFPECLARSTEDIKFPEFLAQSTEDKKVPELLTRSTEDLKFPGPWSTEDVKVSGFVGSQVFFNILLSIERKTTATIFMVTVQKVLKFNALLTYGRV